MAQQQKPQQPTPKIIQNPPASSVAEALRNNQRVVDQAKTK
jgi:hypothetical protein